MGLLPLGFYQCAAPESMQVQQYLSAIVLDGVNAAGAGAGAEIVFAWLLINCKLQGCLPGKPH